MRRAVMIALLCACASPIATSSPGTSSWAAWHPKLGYAMDLCATGAWTTSQDEAVVWPSQAAARDALRAADMNPEDFQIREVP